MTAKEKESLLELASSLIRNRCVNNGRGSGGEERNTALLTGFFAEQGWEARTVYSPGGRANLFLDGSRSPQAPLYGLMGHTDVVPAEESEWSFPPFCGEVKDGMLLGRGAVDMLGQLAAMAAAVRDHLKTNTGKNVRFYAMADEEADGTEGAAWFTAAFPNEIKCDALFSELGGFYLNGTGTGECALVCAEKGVARVRLSASGCSGHGSLPYRSDNALLKIAFALTVLEREMSYPVFGDGFEAFVDGLPLSDDLKSRLKNAETIDHAIDEIAGHSFGLAKYLHGASRLTVMPGIMKAGTKVNVIPDKAFADLDLRLPETMSADELEEVLNRLTPVLDGHVRWEITELTPGNRSVSDNPALRDAIDAACRVNPGIRPVPFISSGVSDSRFWRRRGIPAYGFTVYGRDITADSYAQLLHGPDEKISVDSLFSMYLFYRELLK